MSRVRFSDMRIALFLFLVGSFTLSAQTDTLRIYFNYDDDKISDADLLLLKAIDTSILELNAYCDTNGTTKYNANLASKRLRSVRDVLGIQAARATLHSYGEVSPGLNYSPEKSRRVDVIYPVHVAIAEDESGATQLVDSLTAFLLDTNTRETTINLTIQFYPGSPIVLPQYEDQLWALFDFLHHNQNISAFIRGHVCCADDFPLSFNRAEVVYKFLVNRSIARDRIDYAGYSNHLPAVSPEITEEDRQQNRRVSLIFTKND